MKDLVLEYYINILLFTGNVQTIMWIALILTVMIVTIKNEIYILVVVYKKGNGGQYL